MKITMKSFGKTYLGQHLDKVMPKQVAEIQTRLNQISHKLLGYKIHEEGYSEIVRAA